MSDSDKKWAILAGVSTGLLALHFGVSLLLRKTPSLPELLPKRSTDLEMEENMATMAKIIGKRDKRIMKHEEIYTKHRQNQAIKICFTGGPVAGKTTATTMISQRLTELGYKVFTVPEAKKVHQMGGIPLFKPTSTKADKIQDIIELLRLQMRLEDYFENLAHLQETKAVIFIEGGCMEYQAYLEPDLWQAVLSETNWNQSYLNSKRYHHVIHLTTAAEGAEDYFLLESNKDKRGNFDLSSARELDYKLQQAYMIDNPNHIIVTNKPGQNFEEKIEYVYERIVEILDLKIDVKSMTTLKFLLNKETIQIPSQILVEEAKSREDFLKPPSAEVNSEIGEIRVIKRVALKTWEVSSFGVSMGSRTWEDSTATF